MPIRSAQEAGRGVIGIPDAWTHDRYILATAPVLGAVAASVSGNGALGAAAAIAHVVGGIFLSPDLDVTESSIDNRWGILGFIWRPYALLVPHRSILSHSGVSILVRVLYLVAIAEVALAILGVCAFGDVARYLWGLVQSYPDIATWLSVGLVASDALHTLMDKAGR